MKINLIEFVLAAALLSSSCSGPSVRWKEVRILEDGREEYSMTLRNVPSDGSWSIWFSAMPDDIEVLPGSDASVRKVSPVSNVIVPSENAGRKSRLRINYVSGRLKRYSWAPEGFTFVSADGAESIKAKLKFLRREPSPNPFHELVAMADTVMPGLCDMIPSPKNVKVLEGKTSSDAQPDKSLVEGKMPGWYRLRIDGGIHVEASDEDGFHNARNTIGKLKERPGELDNMEIEDYPDFWYRGFMLDVARNFTSKDNLLKFIDLLSRYKVNYLHLHLSDDEGWRLAVDGIDELTSFGAFHAVPSLDKDFNLVESTALQPSYDGNMDPKSDKLSNGFYSREDFIEILRHAWSRRIMVIPEFDMPGHSRAAIKAMEAYERRTGDSSMRLSVGHRSSEKSAQGYDDNVICVSIPSTYKFIEHVFDYVIGLYNAAGVPFPCIHVGGDEVPAKALTESEADRKFMAENGISDAHGMKAYFVKRVAEIAEARNVRIGGWQELAANLDESTEALLKRNLFALNCWSVDGSSGDLHAILANRGYNVIISDARNVYADMVYSTSMTEKGHDWCCPANEMDSYSLLPYDASKSKRGLDGRPTGEPENEALADSSRIIGIEPTLFTETVRSFDDVTCDIFPKELGAFERAWNAEPAWHDPDGDDSQAFISSFLKFCQLIRDCEMPYWDSAGVVYHRTAKNIY